MSSHSPTQTSTVMSVVIRVAGDVETDIRPHALGYPERQVAVRIGDALIYLSDYRTAERIRQQWDVVYYLAAKRLPVAAGLRSTPPGYPVGVFLRLAGPVNVSYRWVAGSLEHRVPPHLRMQVDRLVWQVCDLRAWHAVGDAWFAAQQHLQE